VADSANGLTRQRLDFSIEQSVESVTNAKDVPSAIYCGKNRRTDNGI
jgi:hypothetical protein